MTEERHKHTTFGLAIWRLKCLFETLAQGSTVGILLNFCAKNPPHRQTPNVVSHSFDLYSMLKEGNIILRQLCDNDATVLAQLANNRKIWVNVRDVLPSPYSIEDAINFIKFTQKENPQMSFAIEYDNQFCGMVGLTGQTDVYKKTAEIGYWIGEPYWNKGIVTIAVKLLTAYGFDQLDFIRIHTGVFEYNIGSMKVLTKNGYEKDGVFKKSILKDGKIYDEHRFSKTK